MKTWLTAPAVAGLVMIVSACGEAPGDDGLVARVGDYTFRVDRVVELLVDEERLPAQVEVIESLADLWIDYTLLAATLAEDSTFGDLDLGPLVRQQVDQVMIFQLRDSVMQPDTFISDDELRELYEAESPDLQMRARHIMLTYPIGATAATRDSVWARLEELRGRILAGASFAALATQFSQDRGSAIVGGDLGFFGRGDMVEPFEEAVLALQVGEVSPVVETPMGLHVIRLEERRVQGFAEIAARFRARVQSERLLVAESTFVADVEERANPQMAEGAFAVTREIAGTPQTHLSRRAAQRPLMEWSGGSYTVGELQDVLQAQEAAFRERVAEGLDEEVERFLRSLAQRKLLVDEARAAGLEPTRERLDSLEDGARSQLRQAARELGLPELDPAPGEAIERAVARAVDGALQKILTGAAQVVPLGQIGFQLREGTANAIFEAGVGQAILRIGRLRATRSPSLLEEAVDTTSQPADSSAP